MRERTITVREGERVGPVDWDHPIAKDMPEIWRHAEDRPASYPLNGREILAMGMYDGWPYWTPRPAVLTMSPINLPEWVFFDSYSVHPNSVSEKSQG